MMKPSEILQTVADVYAMDPKHHVRGLPQKGLAWCVGGAIGMASVESPNSWDDTVATCATYILRVLGIDVDDPDFYINDMVDWNNDRRTSVRKIRDTCYLASELAAREGE